MNLENKHRRGITAGGNWIIDHLKVIDQYPAQDTLANIKTESIGNGGSPYNILKGLSKLGASFPLKGIGLVGDDEHGRTIKNDCSEHGIDIRDLQTCAHAPTSYTDVMTVESSGRRTFFHQRGANAFLDVEHFEFSTSNERLFHLGYLLLLDSLDKTFGDGSTGASRVLKHACMSGLRTSVDLVSEKSDRFAEVVLPALPYVHYLFLNEFEATQCTGVNLMSKKPDFEALNRAATTILDSGVREWVFIHFPKGVFAKGKNGDIQVQGSVKLPKEKVASAVGAGDAFAAGIVYAIHEEWSLPDALKLGVCCAATCLRQPDCSSGILPFQECLNLGNSFGYRTIAESEIEYTEDINRRHST